MHIIHEILPKIPLRNREKEEKNDRKKKRKEPTGYPIDSFRNSFDLKICFHR